MNLHTIKPLADVLNQTDKPYLKFGDLKQIEAKIVNQRQRKLDDPRQQHSVVVEDNYLKILSHLKAKFKTQSRLNITELLTVTDKFIQDNNFLYFPRKHPIAHRNLFYDRADQVYDVAFFNNAATNFIECHHKYKGLSSVFYARFEEKDDHVLIGNLQIDDRHKINSWTKKDVRTILLMRKNIYRAMLQESLKFALAGKKSKIFFQTGDSGMHAQRVNLGCCMKKINITNQNYAKYCTMYENLVKKFDTLQPGDRALNFNHAHGKYGIIIEKSPESYKSVFRHDCLLTAIHTYYDREHEWHYCREPTDAWPLRPIAKEILKIYTAMSNKFERGQPLAVLNQINKLFTIIEPNYKENFRKEKLAYLREHVSPRAARTKANKVIDEFLIKFNYHKIFLKQFPFMRMIKLSEADAQTFGSGIDFYNTQYEKYITETFSKSKIIVPQLGKSRLVHANFPGQELIEADSFEKRLYQFYDNELPKLFTQAGLKFKKTRIRTRSNDKPVTSTAWEIKTGIKKFKERPLVIF